MQSLPIHRRLRDATGVLHERVDRQASDVDLGTLEGQRAFLEMMVRGLSAVEPALDRSGVERVFPQWRSRRRLDAARDELGVGHVIESGKALEFTSEAEIWGALYVLEGSRLGSRFLTRQAPGSRFLAMSARDRSWPDFLAALGAADQRLGDPQGMIRGAEKAFAAFL